jgi:hypothetical protein
MYLISDTIYNSNPGRGFPHYNISINATANSTLPPMINAVEVFSVIPTTNVGTDSQDGTCISDFFLPKQKDSTSMKTDTYRTYMS